MEGENSTDLLDFWVTLSWKYFSHNSLSVYSLYEKNMVSLKEAISSFQILPPSETDVCVFTIKTAFIFKYEIPSFMSFFNSVFICFDEYSPIRSEHRSHSHLHHHFSGFQSQWEQRQQSGHQIIHQLPYLKMKWTGDHPLPS